MWTNNYIYILLIPLFFLVDYISGYEIYQEQEFTPLGSQDHPYKTHFLMTLYSMVVTISVTYLMESFTTTFKVVDVLIFELVFSQFLIALYTDPIVKKINRHFLRVSYLLGLATVIYGLRTSILLPEIQNRYILYIFIVLGVMVVIFFFSNSIGASDFRIMLLTFPMYIYYYKDMAIFVIFAVLITTNVLIMIKLSRTEEKSVAIGHYLLAPAPLLFLLTKI